MEYSDKVRILSHFSPSHNPLSFFTWFNNSQRCRSVEYSYKVRIFATRFASVNNTISLIIPRGSRVELNVDKHPRLVWFLSCPNDSHVLTPNISVKTFHYCPRALSMGSLSRSRFLIVLSSAGMAANTSLKFEMNLVWQKFPLCNNRISANNECTACYVDSFKNQLWCT